jgi:LacI family transcriptional regulator
LHCSSTSFVDGVIFAAATSSSRPAISAAEAVFCVNDIIAFGCMDALRARRIRVPEDVWVAGFDDVSIAGWAAYSLTTVHQPLEVVARAAVQQLEARIAGIATGPGNRRIIAPKLVVRGTAG